MNRYRINLLILDIKKVLIIDLKINLFSFPQMLK